MDSRASRKLAGSKYNERRAEDEEGVAFFQQFDAPIEALRDVDLDLFETHAFDLPETLRRRCRHVITENRRVQERDRALQAEDLEAFGALISAALESLSGDSEVRIAGLDHLVDTARATEGVCGGRMTGPASEAVRSASHPTRRWAAPAAARAVREAVRARASPLHRGRKFGRCGRSGTIEFDVSDTRSIGAGLPGRPIRTDPIISSLRCNSRAKLSLSVLGASDLLRRAPLRAAPNVPSSGT